MFGAEAYSDGQGRARRSCRWPGTPDALPGLCCGTPWKSKGHRDGYDVMVAKVLPALAEASDGDGRMPVVVDSSSCAQGLVTMAGSEPSGDLTVVDAIEFVATQMLPRLTVTAPLPSLALHPTCFSTEMGTAAAMEVIRGATREVGSARATVN